jgi:hypothetical protein
MTLSVKTQHKQYELILLSKIFTSKNFFICMLNDQYKNEYFELKNFCSQHNIQLKIFKNSILKIAFEKTQWSILSKSIFGPIVIGYNLNNTTYSKTDLEVIFKTILQNRSVGFLAGFFYPMLLNQSLLTDLINYNKTLVKDMHVLNSLKFKIATNLFFFQKQL